ncbi:MAG: transketolase family protein, partial [Ruthenibacterium sp.]
LSRNCPVPVESVGINDTFGESGQPEELMERYGLTARDIVAAVHRAIARKHLK